MFKAGFSELSQVMCDANLKSQATLNSADQTFLDQFSCPILS